MPFSVIIDSGADKSLIDRQFALQMEIKLSPLNFPPRSQNYQWFAVSLGESKGISSDPFASQYTVSECRLSNQHLITNPPGKMRVGWFQQWTDGDSRSIPFFYDYKMTWNKYGQRIACLAEETVCHHLWECTFAMFAWEMLNHCFICLGSITNQ